MKKVVCSVSKRNGSQKWSGVGYLAEDNLFVPALSKNGKPYIKVIEGIKGHCVPKGRDKEYSGIVTQAFADVPIFNQEKDRYETRDYLEVEYRVWYKYAD